MAVPPYADEVVDLTASAEAALRRAVEHVGGYEIDRDVAELCSVAANFTTDVERVLEAVSTPLNAIIQDRVPR